MNKTTGQIAIGFVILFAVIGASPAGSFGGQGDSQNLDDGEQKAFEISNGTGSAGNYAEQADNSELNNGEQGSSGNSERLGKEESAVVDITGNKGQAGADVFAGNENIGKMEQSGEERSHFSGKINPGDSVIKLIGNGTELWSSAITAYTGMEYFLDSSEGATVPQVSIQDALPQAAPATPEAKQGSTSAISWINKIGQGFELAEKQKKPIMLYFYTGSSEWCVKLDKDVFTNKDIIDMSSKFIVIKADGEKNPRETERYNVSGYPAILFLSSEGTEKIRVVGYYNSDELVKIMDQAAK